MRVVLADLVCAVVAAVVGSAVRFGPGSLDHLPVWVPPALPLAWVGAVGVARAYKK